MKTALIAGITGQDGSYLTDSSNLNRLLEETNSDEIYNLSAQSQIQVSFEVPEYCPIFIKAFKNPSCKISSASAFFPV